MKIWMRSLLALALLAAGATLNLSCTVNDYCLQCATDDAGGDGGSGMNEDGGDGDGDAQMDAGCVPTGAEECDGKDNDCNGLIDDGVLPMVGQLCPVQAGECAGGVYQCTSGKLECSKKPSPEVCDTLDNNCNGTADEGNPGGGGKCGTDMGECVAGQYQCQGGQVTCVGFIDKTGDPEICDAKDNDCDGNFDEGLTNLGPCGPPTDVGECVRGTLVCQAGGQVCQGAVFPKFEICNNLDDDCDNQIDEIFNKMIDPNNCGTCGNKCLPASKTCINTNNNTNGAMCTTDAQCPGGTCAVNSQPRCQGGTCGFSCNVGFHNLDGVAANGCEYRCFATGAEECDGIDNDCDGNVDEPQDLVPPAICLSGGECGATAPVAQCTGAGGWTCTYPGVVQFPETLCDGLNNDCDANTDEAQPNLGASCSEVPETACNDAVDDDNDGFVNDGCPTVGNDPETGGDCNNDIDDDNDGRINDGCPAREERGVCKSFGTYQCDANNLNGPAVCEITVFGDTPAAFETCDAKDNDCDGKIDEGGASGALDGQEWVDIGGGKQMMKYEASRPDATDTDAGSAPAANPLVTTAFTCSRPGVRPWTNVKYGDAAAACAKIGARLCSEVEWHRACSNIPDVTFPIAAPTTGTFIEAESYKTTQFAGSPVHAWVQDYTAPFSGIGNLEATPNSGQTISAANAVAQAPYVEYELALGASSNNWHVWVKVFANNASNDTIYVGVGTNTPVTTTTVGAFNEWRWVDAALPGTLSGTQTIRIYMGDDGVKIDKLYVIAGSTTATAITNADSLASKGGKWAYATNPNTYQPTTCNGDDLDTNTQLPGDQDDILSTGSLPSCKSNIGSGVFDLSGNVKEWVLRHVPGENPIRGGASNNTGEGISCPLNFTLANDSFFFPNIGFRCCR